MNIVELWKKLCGGKNMKEETSQVEHKLEVGARVTWSFRGQHEGEIVAEVPAGAIVEDVFKKLQEDHPEKKYRFIFGGGAPRPNVSWLIASKEAGDNAALRVRWPHASLLKFPEEPKC